VRVVLDTNVLVSGVFFGGVPGRILSAWAAGKMFAALASHTRLIVSGDKDLLRASGWRGIMVLTPRQFLDQHLVLA